MRNIKEKMEVSQDGVVWEERYVYFIPEGRFCYAVEKGREENFLNDMPYMTERWRLCREIKVEEYRAFNAGEMPFSYFNRPFRASNSSFATKPSKFHITSTFKQICMEGEWLSSDELFNDYEVYGEWGWEPVGVKL